MCCETAWSVSAYILCLLLPLGGEDYVTTVRPQFVLLENTCVNISITIDNMVEGNEEFHVDIYLGAIESGILLNSTTVVIIDSCKFYS